MSMMWNSEGVPPITFLPSGGNGTSSSTSIPSQASPNRDADLAAALIIFLIPALYLLVGPGMPLPNLTCATTLTKADPALAPHALTNTGVTSRDAQQLTLGKITLNSPATERTDLNRLQALAISPEDTPNYLSQLTPPTPIDINKFASYLQGHPDHTTVNHLLPGFSQGFKIGYSGPRAPKEYSNLPCANINPTIIDKNMLKEATLGHTAGPFHIPPFSNLQVYPIWVIPTKHSSKMAYHFPSLLSQTPPHQCQRPHSSRILFFAIHIGGPRNCHTSGSRSRMLHVQTRHKISISQCSRPPLRLGTSGYEMGRALFL